MIGSSEGGDIVRHQWAAEQSPSAQLFVAQQTKHQVSSPM